MEHVTARAVDGAEPAWSPDGTRIALTKFLGGPDRSMICIVEVDGSNERILTALGDLDSSPSWSPDGSEVAFTSWPSNVSTGQGEIHVMDAYSSAKRQLTSTHHDTEDPSWSPDGRSIAFAMGHFESGICVASVDGGEVNRLTSSPDFEPSWAPDGVRIAFARRGRKRSEIWVMNRNGSEEQRLTSSRASESEPAWSPGGSEIAFTRERFGQAAIYVMKINGGAERRLTRRGQHTSWSPDATRVAFELNGELRVINADGSGLRHLSSE